MALQKLTYTDGVTVIPASNLNAIQDAIIKLENSIPDVTTTDNGKVLSVVAGAWAEADLPVATDSEISALWEND